MPHRLIALLMLGLAAMGGPAHAATTETIAEQAIVLDLSTGATLFAKNADDLVPPSSMSKLMTIYVVMDYLKSGRLSLDDTFMVSKKAWKMGGSKMFVLVDTRVRVEDLLRGVVVQSGNDACIVLAEGISGDEESFAELMIQTARRLGLEKSTFRNSTGWPDPEHRMTVREIALVARHLIEDFPEYYGYFAETEYTYNDITQPNRNVLLSRIEGVDGLKTGYTEAAGYGIAVSAEREGHRIVVVVNGLNSARERVRESGRLVEWAYREFSQYALYGPGETVDTVSVWGGTESDVAVVAPQGARVTLPRTARKGMKVVLAYDGPVPAPIQAGDTVARLVVTAPDTEPVEIPLVAKDNVEEEGFFGRIGSSLGSLLIPSL